VTWSSHGAFSLELSPCDPRAITLPRLTVNPPRRLIFQRHERRQNARGVSYLTPAKQLVPVFNCDPPPEFGFKCEPQGTRWHDGKLYLTTRHIGIIVYDPQTKKVSPVVSTYRNQLFKGPNDLDFDADGNLYFTDPWGTGAGPETADTTTDT
jgi:hypothetical protein